MSLASFGAIFTAAALRQTSVAITFVLTDIKRYAMQIANSRYRFTISWHWMLIYPKYWTATRDVIGLYPLSIRVQTQGWPHGKLGARCWKWCYIISYLASGKLINTKIVLGDCKCLNWKKFRISCHLVSSLQDARSLENINCAIILLWAVSFIHWRPWKSFGKTVYK